MARQNISVGSSANDGTGDTLRQAAQKINQTFVEVYQFLGGDSDLLSGQVSLEDSAVVFEGATADAFETRLTASNVGTDRVIRLPDASGIITLNTATQTLTNKSLTSPTITTPKLVTRIDDTNGNELIRVTATGSAVNDITIANADSGNAPTISATGDNANINLALSSKGTGAVSFNKAAFSSVEQTSNGTASQLATHIICNKASALAVTLADGTTSGELKIFTNTGAGTATVTVTSGGDINSVSIPQNKTATFIWDGTYWRLVSQYGATVS